MRGLAANWRSGRDHAQWKPWTRDRARKYILFGIRGAGYPPTEEDVERLLDHAFPRTADVPHKKVAAYLQLTGRNWALDQLRAAERVSRMAKKRVKKELALRALKNEYDNAKWEFDVHLRNYSGGRLTQAQEYSLWYLWLNCFQGLSDDEIAPEFPGTTKNQRFKWKERGLALMNRVSSSALQGYLKRCKSKKSEGVFQMRARVWSAEGGE